MPDWVPTRRRQIGQSIRSHRRDVGLSQIQLGERVGRDHKTISRWENAVRVPSLTDLLLIADALGVELDELVRRPAAGA